MRSIILVSSAAALVTGVASIALMVPAQAAPLAANPAPAAGHSFTFTTGCGEAIATNNTNHVLTAQFSQVGENASYLRSIDVRPGGHITLHSRLSSLKVVTVDQKAGTREVTQAKIGAGCSTPTHHSPAAQPAKSVTLKGDGRIGNPLKAETRAWGEGTRLSFQWLREGRAIAGATRSTYVPRTADSYKKISVKVTGHQAGHSVSVRTSRAILVGPATV